MMFACEYLNNNVKFTDGVIPVLVIENKKIFRKIDFSNLGTPRNIGTKSLKIVILGQILRINGLNQ